MAILKVINEARKYKDSDSVESLINYCTNKDKTNGFIGAYSVSPYPEQAIFQMNKLQTLYGKNNGTHLRHMVVSFESDDNIPPNIALEIGYKIAAYYGCNYQIIFGVHLDTYNTHIHFVMNTVNYNTGLKYDGSHKDLTNFTNYIQEILTPYNINIFYKK